MQNKLFYLDMFCVSTVLVHYAFKMMSPKQHHSCHWSNDQNMQIGFSILKLWAIKNAV